MPKKTSNIRPLKILIDGENLHIEATFSDMHLSELLAGMIKRVNASMSEIPHTGPKK